MLSQAIYGDDEMAMDRLRNRVDRLEQRITASEDSGMRPPVIDTSKTSEELARELSEMLFEAAKRNRREGSSKYERDVRFYAMFLERRRQEQPEAYQEWLKDLESRVCVEDPEAYGLWQDVIQFIEREKAEREAMGEEAWEQKKHEETLALHAELMSLIRRRSSYY